MKFSKMQCAFNRLIFKLIIIVFSLSAGQAYAQITVNDVIIHFKAGNRPLQNLTVSNSSEATLYVTVNAEKILEPGVENSKFEPADNLLVSPKKFSIDAKGERSVRLVMKKQPEGLEEVYRVTFIPQDRGFGDDLEQEKTSPKAILRVLTGMGILVFADPIKPEVKLSWTRANNKIVFRNDGNLHVRLIQGKACIKENEGCTDLPAKRIYGNTTFTLDVDDKKTLFFTKREGTSGDYQSLVIPPA